MPDEIDFSGATRGKFYRDGMKLRLPVYPDDALQERLTALASAKGVELLALVNDLLRKNLSRWRGRRRRVVDFTGRQLKPGKRGVIASSEPPALRKLGIDADFWTGHVKWFRSAYQRFVGGIEAMAEKAKALNQQWLKGIGYARSLAANR